MIMLIRRILLSITVILIAGYSTHVADFRNVSWGMSLEEVHAAESLHKPIKGFYIGMPETEAITMIRKHYTDISRTYPDAYLSVKPSESAVLYTEDITKTAKERGREIDILASYVLTLFFKENKLKTVTFGSHLFGLPDGYKNLTKNEKLSFAKQFEEAYGIAVANHNGTDWMSGPECPIYVWLFHPQDAYLVILMEKPKDGGRLEGLNFD